MIRSAVLFALLAASAACRRAPETGGKTVIRYLANPDVGGFSKDIIRRFEAANPDVAVEMVEGPSSPDTREDMYATSFMAKEDAYDMVYMDLAWLPKFASQGWLRPLDDLFPPEKQKEFLPGDIEGSRFQGRIYRLPLQSDGGLLYYRKDLLAAKGFKPPQTWDELLRQAKAIQSPPELWGFVFQGKQYEGLVCDFLEFLWGNGGELVDEQGNVKLDSPEAAEALSRMADAIRKDKISPEAVLTYQEEEARHAFQEGHAVFMRNWPYAWNLTQAESSPVKGKVGIIPMVHGKGHSAATLGGWGFGISAYSKHPEAAFRLMEFFASHDSEKLAFFKGGILPTRKSVYADKEVLAKSPQIKDLYAVLSLAHPRPMVPGYARISDALQVHLSAALSGQEEPRRALAEAAADIRVAVMLR